jgi:hypothetical protein
MCVRVHFYFSKGIFYIIGWNFLTSWNSRLCPTLYHKYNEIVLGEPWHNVKVKLATSDAEKVFNSLPMRIR